MEKKKRIYKMVVVGVLSALVFVSNYLQITIPVGIGDATRIHFGNAICLLAGLVAGPVGGGLAAGIGSFCYDLTNPLYIASAPFTFIFKFIMAYIAGLFMKKSNSMKSVSAVIGALLGQVAYIVLYLGKSFITGVLEGSAPEAMVPIIWTKLGASASNAVIAIIIASALSVAVQKALKSSKISLN